MTSKVNRNDGKKGRIEVRNIKYFDAATAENFETEVKERKKKYLCLSNQSAII